MINRSDFVREVAKRANITIKDAKSIMSAVEDTIYAHMKDDEVRAFDGITFKAVERSARTMKNPRTGEIIDVEAKLTPRCKFGRKAKQVVNGIIEVEPWADEVGVTE